MGPDSPDAVADWLTSLPSSTPPVTPTLSQSPGAGVLKRKRGRESLQSPTTTGQDSSSPMRPRPALRLTRRALKEVSTNMSGTASEVFQTPIKPVQRQSSRGELSGLQTPSNSSSSPSTTRQRQVPKLSKNIHNERQSLADHGMLYNDIDAWEHRCPDLRKKIDALFARTRTSAMKDASAKAANKTLRRYYTQNESSLFGRLLPGLIKDSRTIHTNKRTADDEQIYMDKEFADDGLMVLKDCRFLKNLLPGQGYTSEEKKMGLTDPVPDWTYGVEHQSSSSRDTTQQPHESIKALRNVASGVDWAFFVIETKSVADSIAAAENQAIRDGAVLLNARLQLNDCLRAADAPQPPPGSDQDSFIFSCAMTPEIARLSVHWFERLPDGSELFHMQTIRSYLMERAAELRDFRKDTHNILDWGLLEYRRDAEEVWKKIIAKDC